MFASRLNGGADAKENSAAKNALLAKLKKKRQSQPFEQEQEQKQEKEQEEEQKNIQDEDENEDVDMDNNDSSSNSSSSESETELESNEKGIIDKDAETNEDFELNLLKRPRSEEEDKEEGERRVTESELESESNKQHSSIISRFKQTMKLQPQLASIGQTIDSSEPSQRMESLPINDVKPLPQPSLPKDSKLYSQEYKNKNLNWLTKPAYYSTKLTKPFKEIGGGEIYEPILKNIKEQYGFENAFSIQVTLIEELLKDISRQRLDPTPRNDYLINASTGSGKTLSYLIPVIQSLLKKTASGITRSQIQDCDLHSIILVPTKPLVNQVHSDLLKLTQGINISSMAIKGDVSIEEERSKLLSGQIDIVVTTPGRLMDHIDYISLKGLKFLIIDEADKLLNQSYQNWVEKLIGKIDENYIGGEDDEWDLDNVFKIKCVKLILSATLTTNSEKLTNLKLFKPKLVVVNDSEGLINELYQLPPTLDEFLVKSIGDAFIKPLILLKILSQVTYSNFSIVFVKSNDQCIRLAKLLAKLVSHFQLTLEIKYVSSTMKVNERNKILKDFNNNGGILISTDLLSRGVDFTNVSNVINYDLPMSTKEYIHRVGRTARGGKSGHALSMVMDDGEFKWFKKLVYSGGLINRHKKEIRDQFTGDELQVSDDERRVYEDKLRELQKEV